MLDVLCACDPARKFETLRDALSCERTFTAYSSPPKLPAGILGVLRRPNNIGHDIEVLSMN